jgi:hypothetical protein
VGFDPNAAIEPSDTAETTPKYNTIKMAFVKYSVQVSAREKRRKLKFQQNADDRVSGYRASHA